jgi:hypothetical protein
LNFNLRIKVRFPEGCFPIGWKRIKIENLVSLIDQLKSIDVYGANPEVKALRFQNCRF